MAQDDEEQASFDEHQGIVARDGVRFNVQFFVEKLFLDLERVSLV